MSKAIYTIMNGRIFKIVQDTAIPSILAQLPSQDCVSTSMDDHLKTVTETVKISNMETSCVKTNAEKYKAFTEYLRKMEITQIDAASNNFQVFIDYAICSNGCELTHSVVIKPISAKDAAILLGVATDNELVYRRVKLFEQKVQFGINNPLPLGIMDSSKKNYVFKINDITLYQDLSVLTGENLHNSIYENPCHANCNCNHSTINDSLIGFTPVFSTSAAGLCISNVEIDFVPRKIIIDLKLTIADYIVAYDDTDINNIIQENIDKKYAPIPDPGGEGGGGTIPDSDDLPDADGDETPDEDGKYDYYERCLSTNPDALLVVEDLISDKVFDKTTMIRKKKVLLDIPDIMVGEYVHYVTAIKDDPITEGQEVVGEDDTSDDTTSTDTTTEDTTEDNTDTTEDDDETIMLDIDSLNS